MNEVKPLWAERRDEKKALELAILRLIREFEKKYDCVCQRIDVDHLVTVGMDNYRGHAQMVKVDFELV